MKRFFSQRTISIGTILNVYSIVLTLLPVMIVVSIAVSLFGQQARQQAVNQMAALAETKQQEIERWLENSKTILKLIMTNPEQYRRMSDILLSGAPQPAKVTNITNFLQSQLELQGVFQELFLYNLDAKVLVSTDLSQVGVSLEAQHQPYIDKGLQGITLQAPYYDPVRREMTALVLEPVYHSSGNLLGVLVGRLNLTTLSNIMTTRVGLGLSGETYLIGQERSNFITPSRFIPYEPSQSYHSLGIDAALKQQAGQGFYEDYRGIEVIGVYRWLPELDSAMLAEVDANEALQAIERVQQISFFVALVAVLVAFAVGVSVTRWIIQPIQNLTQVALAIMAGDYDQKADVTVKNEVGQLAHAFNIMTTQLRDLIYGLEERVQARTLELKYQAEILEKQTVELEIQGLRLQQANTELARTNADKDRFFSIVAHDLKGPFMPLLGNAELLTEMGDVLPAAEVKQLGASIQRTAKSVFGLLENLLQWARLQMGRMDYQPQRLDLAEIVAKTVELLSGNAAVKQIVLHSEVQPKTWIYADENMLDTVIRNLTNNALKFTPQGGQVTISSELRVKSDALKGTHHYIEVSIADSGVGMPPEVQQKLFKIDEHVTTIGTGKETGTGLGLIICHEMVVKSGGHIWVESAVGQGTTVRFTVKLDKTS